LTQSSQDAADAAGRAPLRRIFANTGLLLGGRGGGAILNIAATALAARALGIEAFGVLMLLQTYAFILNEAGTFQTWKGGVRYGAPALDDGRTGDLKALIKGCFALDLAGVAATAALGVAAILAAGALLGWQGPMLIGAALYSLVLLFGFKSAAIGVLRLLDRFDLLAAHSVITPAIRLAGAALCWGVGAGLGGFLAAWFAAGAGTGLAAAWLAWRELRRHGLDRDYPPLSLRLGALFPRFWRFLWFASAQTSLQEGMRHAPLFVTGAVLGAGGAGLYKAAHQVATIVSKPASLFMQSIFPELSRAAARSREELWSLLLRSAALNAAGGGAVLLLYALFGRTILGGLFGAEFVDAFGLLLLLSLGAVILFAGAGVEPALLSLDRTGRLLAIQAVSAALQVALTFAGLAAFGLVGAGLAVALTAALTVAAQAAALAWRR